MDPKDFTVPPAGETQFLTPDRRTPIAAPGSSSARYCKPEDRLAMSSADLVAVGNASLKYFLV